MFLFIFIPIFFIFFVTTSSSKTINQYPIFISNVLVSNVGSFKFERKTHRYNLILKEYAKNVSLSVFLNVWEDYLYGNISVDYLLFLVNYSALHLDREQNLENEKLFLTRFYVHVNGEKYNFFNFPLNIPINEKEEKTIQIYYDSSETFTFTIRNAESTKEFFLENAMIINPATHANLLLQDQFSPSKFLYRTYVDEDVQKLNIKSSCFNSHMYINNKQINDEFIFYLNERTYNNILIIECRQYEYERNLNKRKREKPKPKQTFPKWFQPTAYLKFIETEKAEKNDENNFAEIEKKDTTYISHTITSNKQKKEKETNFIKHVMTNIANRNSQEKTLDTEKEKKEQNAIDQNQRIIFYKSEFSNYQKGNHIFVKKKTPIVKYLPIIDHMRIKIIKRKFYFFNIFYKVPIKLPVYLYNLIEGSVCYLSLYKNQDTINEYVCDTKENKVTFYSDINQKLYAYIYDMNQNKMYRFINKMLNGTIPYTSNLYLILESYYAKNALKIIIHDNESSFFFSRISIFIFIIILIVCMLLKYFLR